MPRTDLPPHIQQVFFDFHWVREKLWAIRLPTESARVADMDWLLDLPIWQRTPTQIIFDLTPREVLREPKRFPDHWGRIESAEFSFPLLLMPNLSGRWVIMDGYHRLARASILGMESLEVMRLPRSLIPVIRRPD